MTKEQRNEINVKKKTIADIDAKVLRLLTLGYKYDSQPIKALDNYRLSLKEEIEQIKTASGARR